MDERVKAYIGLGSNLGDRKVNIDSAVQLLADTDRIEVMRVSDMIETAPLASTSQPKYLNAVVEIRTDIGAIPLRRRIVEIETALGRVRPDASVVQRARHQPIPIRARVHAPPAGLHALAAADTAR